MQIQGSTVLLTGASGGLGSATARTLAKLGANLVLTARRKEVLDELAEETGGEVVAADIGDRAQLDALCERLVDVDILVANAGIGDVATVAETTNAEIDQVLDVNLRAPIVLATQFAQSKMAQSEVGQIVLIGSLSGVVATPNTTMYNATKFGLRGYSHALRLDLEDAGIGVTYLAPGFIREAGMFVENEVELPPGLRTKSPEDVAAGVVKAIEKNPIEIFVSPMELRGAATLGGLSPRLSAALQKRMDTKSMTKS